MQAEIFEIKRFAVHDGDGVRTTVFFKGCPLRCRWCHNPEGLKKGCQLSMTEHLCTLCGKCEAVCPNHVHEVAEIHRVRRENCGGCKACVRVCPQRALRLYGRTVTVDELMPELLEDREFFEASGGGVTFSGGECLMQAEFCTETARRLHAEGISVDIDTCGFVPERALDEIAPFTDCFLYDLKAFDEAVHIACTGQSNRLILSNLRHLNEIGSPVEIRIPCVPECNGGELEKLRDFLRGLSVVRRVTVLPYHKLAESKYRALGMEPDMPERVPTDGEMAWASGLFAEWNGL